MIVTASKPIMSSEPFTICLPNFLILSISKLNPIMNSRNNMPRLDRTWKVSDSRVPWKRLK